VPDHLTHGTDGHLLFGPDGHLCITCCDGGDPTWIRGLDCKNADEPLDIYVPSLLAPGSSNIYPFGGYCVRFAGDIVTEVPEDADEVEELPDAIATCELCSPDPCPTDNDLCNITFEATLIFPESCGDPIADLVVDLVPQGDGTWFWESETEGESVLVDCVDGIYWRATYTNSTACAGVVMIWQTPRFGDCPAETEGDEITIGVVWAFISESPECCGGATFLLTLPE
jgi:hypothetical protein